ncbi:MAG: glycosyltransferase [Deltaproteobacteria bacterium]|nr:glycosyltransferase [Deltaproteobacteria bacterium]
MATLNVGSMGARKQRNHGVRSDRNSKSATLSLCMIVKDEQAWLGRCLQSVKGCVDEIVVVDTGSTDRTVEIAKGFGARVYFHPWEGDFAKHQNQAIDHATGDWILRMDADEVLAADSCKKIREAIEDDKADAFFINYLSFFNNGASCLRESKIRIFRNLDEIRYQGAVHEQLTGYRHPRTLNVDTYHYGYDLNGKEKERKLRRTTALIKKEIDKDPKNYFQHLCLAQCYAVNDQYPESIEQAFIGLRLMNEFNVEGHEKLWALYMVSSGFLKIGDLQEAEKHAKEAVAISPDHLDCLFVLTVVYHMRKDWEKLYETALGFLKVREALDHAPEEYAFSSFNMSGETWRVHIALGDFYLDRKDMESACRHFDKATLLTRTPLECHQLIGGCYRRAGLWDAAKRHYELALRYNVHDNTSAYGLAVSLKLSGDEQTYLDFVRRFEDSKVNHAGLCIEKGIVSLKDGAYDRAVEYFEKAQALDPNWTRGSSHTSDGWKREQGVFPETGDNDEAITPARDQERPPCRFNSLIV